MAHRYADRVMEVTTSTGTGDLTLGGAAGIEYRTFAEAGFAAGDTTDVCILDPATGAWETCAITLAAGGVIQRGAIYESSNGNARVDFGAGQKRIFVGLPAAEAVRRSAIPVTIAIDITAENEAVTAGAAAVTWHAPWPFTVTAFQIGLKTSSSSGSVTVDVNLNGTSILSAPLSAAASVDWAETTGIATASIPKGGKITIDKDAAGAGAVGLKGYLIGTRSA